MMEDEIIQKTTRKKTTTKTGRDEDDKKKTLVSLEAGMRLSGKLKMELRTSCPPLLPPYRRTS